MRLIAKVYFVLNAQLGIDPIKAWRSIRGLPKYIRNFIKFRKSYDGIINFLPCLHDWDEEGGTARGEYFTQDLLVARMICKKNPLKHVDIGSRVDGFVAHVASFRQIEVFDVRQMKSTFPGITFRQADLMSHSNSLKNYCDSLSCLHALEHFGLGRYGDPISPDGYKIGFSNMASMLKSGGSLYLSVPIGTERVEFNAHRIFDLSGIVKLGESLSLMLTKMIVLDKAGTVVFEDRDPSLFEHRNTPYHLGIFLFDKP